MFPNKEHGFMAYDRKLPGHQPVQERIQHYDEFTKPFPDENVRKQAYRCMNCGVPFCHSGCPLGNIIPDFNDAVKDGDWQRALEILHSTNNFPEFTGRVCPAPCEASCVLGITDPPVAIELIEKNIAEHGWTEGRIVPRPPARETGKSVAVVGSGPAGLAAAQQLRRAGHRVTVFERSDSPGGLLTYGIPDFKLSKQVVRRRVDQLKAEGVEFQCNAWLGKNRSASELDAYDAVLLTIGSTKARKLDVPGSELNGVEFAVDFLTQQNRRNAGKPVEGEEILATGKNVVVLGGGDTGSDCVGTSLRQGALQVHSLELLPKPPLERDNSMLWPMWPMILRTSTSHEEGGQRSWSVLTKEFVDDGKGNVKQLRMVRLEWSEPDASGRRNFSEMPDSDIVLDCDLVLLALGFLHPEHDTVVSALGLELDARGNIKADPSFRTSREKYYAAGDARRGQSLVVWAIHEGREAARCIDQALMGQSALPSAYGHGYLAPKL